MPISAIDAITLFNPPTGFVARPSALENAVQTTVFNPVEDIVDLSPEAQRALEAATAEANPSEEAPIANEPTQQQALETLDEEVRRGNEAINRMLASLRNLLGFSAVPTSLEMTNDVARSDRVRRVQAV